MNACITLCVSSARRSWVAAEPFSLNDERLDDLASVQILDGMRFPSMGSGSSTQCSQCAAINSEIFSRTSGRSASRSYSSEAAPPGLARSHAFIG
jgi:hypothetical protein